MRITLDLDEIVLRAARSKARAEGVGDVEAITSWNGDKARLGPDRATLEEEFAAGRMRPEWCRLATDPHGDLVGRALWWGRDASKPIALDVLDVAASVSDRAAVGAQLLLAGHAALRAGGWDAPLPYTVRLPLQWREQPVSTEAVAWRRTAAAAAGLTEANERHQFQWSGAALPHPPHLSYRRGTDAEFLDLFADVARGSLDVLTRRSLRHRSAQDLARDELRYYLECPGDRDWWRVAYDAADIVVGFVIPSATPRSRNVGYLGVLPAHRGRHIVDDLLAYVTHVHVASGAATITATTDAVNQPMEAAFLRAGYRLVEARLDLEPPDA